MAISEDYLKEYLREFAQGGNRTFIDQLSEYFRLFEDFTGIEATDFFIMADGEIHLFKDIKNVWLFNSDVMIILNPNSNNYQFNLLKINNISKIFIDKRPKNTTLTDNEESSLLTITLYDNNEKPYTLSTNGGTNADRLKDIFQKYIVKNKKSQFWIG